MASGLLLGLLVGGPGLFPTYFASARATCTPPTAFVSSALRLVKGYKLPPAALEEKVTFTILPQTSHVPEVVHRLARLGTQVGSRCGLSWPTCARCINRRFTSLCLFAYHPPSRPRALLMAEWMIAFVWGRARCRRQAHDCVICARQLFGDNTVLPHYESHTVNLT